MPDDLVSPPRCGRPQPPYFHSSIRNCTASLFVCIISIQSRTAPLALVKRCNGTVAGGQSETPKIKTKYGLRVYVYFLSLLRDYCPAPVGLMEKGSLVECQLHRPCEPCQVRLRGAMHYRYMSRVLLEYYPYLQNIPPLDMSFCALPNAKVTLVKAVVCAHDLIFIILQRITKNGKRRIGITVNTVFDHSTSTCICTRCTCCTCCTCCRERLDDEHVARAIGRCPRRQVRVIDDSVGIGIGVGEGIAEHMYLMRTVVLGGRGREVHVRWAVLALRVVGHSLPSVGFLHPASPKV
jgi:hypothetical protein